MARRKPVEQHDLQGNVLCGYGFPLASFVFLRVDEAGAGRALLAALSPRLTNAVSWGLNPPPATLNVAVSWRGLRALGAPDALLAAFPEEFRLGMDGRADLLGDVGDAAPERWVPGLRPGEVHLLVTLYAREPAGLEAARAELAAELPAGVAVVHEREAALLQRPGEALAREHFGFADGFAQPSIDDPLAGPYEKPGQGTPEEDGGWRPLAPGEFVLGYEDEDRIEPGEELGWLGRNASFSVVRELAQDVAGFRSFLREQAGEDGAEALAARLMGRWRDGTPLVHSPDRPDPELAADQRGERLNDFRYSDDPNGFRCPIGSHVRRANPRDALGWGSSLSRRHRIIRRGMPYGPPLPEDSAGDERERGLVFVCHQASLARQFEVVQGSWIADGDAFRLGDDPDPILGGPALDSARPAKMTLQGDPPRLVGPLARFVLLRGGEYLFTPSLAAAARLGRGAW
jgi:Dyp-type peroxidase family